jgi:2-dehydropantoate 2-reductase
VEVVTEHGETIVVSGPVNTDPRDVPAPVATVFLAVKAPQVRQAAGWLTRLCGPHTVLVVLLNGVEHRSVVEPYLTAAHQDRPEIVPAVIWFPAAREGGRTILRGTPSLTLPDVPASHAVAELLTASKCRVELTDDFLTASWRKLLQNAAAGIMALTGRRAGVFGRDDIAELTRHYLGECAAVAAAEGARLSGDIAEEVLAQFRSYPPDLGTSILADRDARQPLEWDLRNGVVARLGRVHGIPTPVGDVVATLLAATSDGPG